MKDLAFSTLHRVVILGQYRILPFFLLPQSMGFLFSLVWYLQSCQVSKDKTALKTSKRPSLPFPWILTEAFLVLLVFCFCIASQMDVVGGV